MINGDLGYVYFISTDDGKKVKIGMTRGDNPESRLGSLQTGCPVDLCLSHAIKCEGIDPQVVERDLHKVFRPYALRGEWFECVGVLAWFMYECVHSQENGIARIYGKTKDRWGFVSKCGKYIKPPLDTKSPMDDPLRAAMYESKTTGDHMAGENAGLRIIIEKMICANTKLAAVVEAYSRAEEVADALKEEMWQDSKDGTFGGLANKVARESDENKSSLLYAYEALTDDKDSFGGSAVFFARI